jgi:DNA-directed RNA polymerase subunit RPC12/RpoP
MQQDSARQCPQCGQALRFPENIGGMLMACPSCGHRFATPFRLAGPGAPTAAPAPKPTVVPLQTGPNHAAPEPAQPAEPTSQAPKPSRALAARVAAIYAAKAS